MSDESPQTTSLDKESLFKLVLECLEVAKPDLIDAFNPVEQSSYLGSDLNLQSIEFVRMVSTIQSRFEGVCLPFQELFVTPNGNLVEDITVQNVIDFLYGKLT